MMVMSVQTLLQRHARRPHAYGGRRKLGGDNDDKKSAAQELQPMPEPPGQRLSPPRGERSRNCASRSNQGQQQRKRRAREQSCRFEDVKQNRLSGTCAYHGTERISPFEADHDTPNCYNITYLILKVLQTTVPLT